MRTLLLGLSLLLLLLGDSTTVSRDVVVVVVFERRGVLLDEKARVENVLQDVTSHQSKEYTFIANDYFLALRGDKPRWLKEVGRSGTGWGRNKRPTGQRIFPLFSRNDVINFVSIEM